MGKAQARATLRDMALVYLGYGFRFVSPLLLYPLLAHRLGAEAFGLYVSAYALALMLSVGIEYGFNLSATRDVALTRDARERGVIAGRVVAARLLLLAPVVPLGALLGWFNPVLGGHGLTCALAIVLGCLQGSTAFWYFQGVGRVLVAVALEIAGQVAALAAVFLLVRSPADVELALGLQVLGFGATALLGNWLMFGEAPWRLPGVKPALRTLREGFALFLGRSAVMVFTAASVFLVAGMAGPLEAALFGAAERVVGAFIALLRPLSSVVLPRLARLMVAERVRGLRLGKAIAAGMGGLYAIVALVLMAGAGLFMPWLFGADFADSITPLQWLAAALPLIAVNTVLGSHVMVSLRLDRQITLVLCAAGAVNLILALVLVPLWQASGMAVARGATELFIAALYLLIIRHRQAGA